MALSFPRTRESILETVNIDSRVRGNDEPRFEGFPPFIETLNEYAAGFVSPCLAFHDIESILNPVNLCPVNRHHIKPTGRIVPRMQQIVLRGALQAFALGQRNAVGRAAVIAAAAIAHFNKHQAVATAHHQINLTAFATIVARQALQTPTQQIFERQPFAALPGLLGGGAVFEFLDKSGQHACMHSDNHFPAGTLYVVATPIGNLDDITLRALACLKIVDRVAAEDTRHSRGLLQHYGIDKPLLAVHEHNEREAATGLIARLQAGERIALITDAGTPAISDPGARVVDAVRTAGLPVIPLPGACAAIAALSASGLLGNSFHFEGFLPGKTSARQQRLDQLALLPSPVVLYEAPHRIVDTLSELAQAFGDSRQILIARELTKRFEQTVRLPLAQACQWIAESPDHQRGEFVLVLAAAEEATQDALSAEAARLMDLLLPELPPKRAAAIAAAATGANKKVLYDYGLQSKANPES